MRTQPQGPAAWLARSLLCGGVALILAGCSGPVTRKGSVSRKPPIHLNPNMDQQRRIEAQEPGGRPHVEGTVARGSLHEDDHLYRGQLADGSWADALPSGLSFGGGLLSRGRERYDIYCAPCHDTVGTGKGSAVARGMLQPPTFHDDRVRALRLGEIYGVITDGVRNMPSYAAQVPVEDRWAIAAYVRALQVAQNANIDDVPMDHRAVPGRDGQ